MTLSAAAHGSPSLEGAGVWPAYRSCSRATWRGEWPPELAALSPSTPLPPSTLITGPVGCGKTHIATALLVTWQEAGQRGLWRDVGDLLRQVKATFGMEPGEFLDPLERLRTCDFLVLDDLGAEQPTDWNESAIGQLIRYRHGHSRKTIVTTNLAAADLEPRVASRISAGLVIRLAGRDRRREFSA